MPDSFTIDFDSSKIDQVYEGRLNVCRCGCAGEYYEPSAKDPEQDKAISKALDTLISYNARGNEILYSDFGDRIYFEIKTDEFNKSDMDDEDYEDWDGGYDEVIEMGLAFYLKK